MNNKFIYWLKIILLLSAIVVVEFFALCAGTILGNSKRFAEILDSNYYNVSSAIQSKSVDTLSIVSPLDSQANISEFESSPFLLPVSYVTKSSGRNWSYDSVNFINLRFKIFSDGSFCRLGVDVLGDFYSYNNYYSGNVGEFGYKYFDLSFDRFTDCDVIDRYINYNELFCMLPIFVDSGFISDLSYASITYVDDGHILGYVNGLFLTFVDINGKKLMIEFPGPPTNNETPDSNHLYFESLVPERIIYFSDEVTDNSFYYQGFDAGYNQGKLDGELSGYNTGYNSGYNDGYFYGYDVGSNSTNQYTFSNLLTAVVEAPVNVLISLLDFNIMGYNLLSIVVGLLSLGVIVVIIKLCLGGK